MEEKNELEEFDFDAAWEKHFQEIISLGKDKCCVCHHDLSIHVDEGDIWRCHSLAADGFQCECALRKNRADNDKLFYDFSRRAREHIKELRKEIYPEKYSS